MEYPSAAVRFPLMERGGLEQLRRDLRFVQRLLIVFGAVIVALITTMVVLATHTPDTLEIGGVSIGGDHISIEDPDGETAVSLTAKSISVSDRHTGGVGLFPAELVVNDVRRTQSVRISAWSDSHGQGTAAVAVESRRSEQESAIRGPSTGSIHISTSRSGATLFASDRTGGHDLLANAPLGP